MSEVQQIIKQLLEIGWVVTHQSEHAAILKDLVSGNERSFVTKGFWVRGSAKYSDGEASYFIETGDEQ